VIMICESTDLRFEPRQGRALGATATVSCSTG
jgi:hypothetical protein